LDVSKKKLSVGVKNFKFAVRWGSLKRPHLGSINAPPPAAKVEATAEFFFSGFRQRLRAESFAMEPLLNRIVSFDFHFHPRAPTLT
jgi:hypothetical protein